MSIGPLFSRLVVSPSSPSSFQGILAQTTHHELHTMPAGRLPDSAIHRHFEYKSAGNGRKVELATCLCCRKYKKARNTSRQEQHLLKCPKYLEWERSNTSKLQTKITSYIRNPIDPTRKSRLDQKFALAIYTTGRPFSTIEDPA